MILRRPRHQTKNADRADAIRCPIEHDIDMIVRTGQAHRVTERATADMPRCMISVPVAVPSNKYFPLRSTRSIR